MAEEARLAKEAEVARLAAVVIAEAAHVESERKSKVNQSSSSSSSTEGEKKV